jgi:hypothetical protein
MASVNMIPWEQALAAEKAAFDQNRQMMMMGVAPEGGFRNDYAYMGDTFDPEKWLQQKGFWQQGFRPGMDLPQINASNAEDFIEMATPFIVMGATAAGGNALFGPGGLFAGAPAAGSAAAGSSAASGASAAGGAMMPPAIPPVDPTFGGALSQVSPGVFANTGNYAAFGGVGAGAGALAAAPSAGTVTAGGAPVSASASGMPVASSALPTTTSALSSALPGVLSNPQVLGMGAGALLGGMGGSSGPAGTTTTEQGIPDWLMPYVKPALDKYSTDIQNYNVDPYGVMPAAMQEFKNTVGGMYLDPSTNKWLDEYYKLGAERIKGTISPSFGHMQAFGSHSGYNEALSRGLGDFSVGLFGGNYQKERDRQQQMTAAAPSFLQSSSQAAFAPYQGYLNTVGGLGKKTQQPYFEGSDMQNALGGALAGWGLGNLFKT